MIPKTFLVSCTIIVSSSVTETQSQNIKSTNGGVLSLFSHLSEANVDFRSSRLIYTLLTEIRRPEQEQPPTTIDIITAIKILILIFLAQKT